MTKGFDVGLSSHGTIWEWVDTEGVRTWSLVDEAAQAVHGWMHSYLNITSIFVNVIILLYRRIVLQWHCPLIHVSWHICIHLTTFSCTYRSNINKQSICFWHTNIRCNVLKYFYIRSRMIWEWVDELRCENLGPVDDNSYCYECIHISTQHRFS